MTKDTDISMNNYIQALQKELEAGNATEHTHRTALKILLESLGEKITATNEPQRIKCGAPDFIITKGTLTIGYIETKDIDKSLDETEKTEQIKRYLDSLSNFILTDYLEFRWFIDGKLRLKARLGVTSNVKIKRDKDGIQNVAELLASFLSHKAEGVGTPKDLALRMARLAHLIRNLIINTFTLEAEKGSLHAQLAAFRDNLIPDLSVEYFADMYAQTIAYGLFAARCTSKNGAAFTRLDAAQNLPRTNPFLRKLFQYIAGYDLDDRIAWLVDDLAQILAQADMEAVLKDFGKHTGKEDPVVHFYETFLKEYDEKIREMRGVYYTPEPVVSYIVRSIDHLLKDRFNKPQGLADDKTLILDPAVGTATFLYMAINEIHQAIAGKGQQGMWNNYVAEKLLPRIFGFELLMAPYAVAHLKLGLLLQQTGYEFKSEQRLGIYLTNTLEEAIKRAETLFARWISEEANAAARVKKDEPIMVVLGNPPYSGHSANKGEWARQLVDRYKTIDGKPLGEKNPKWLQDDYVKFLAFGQWRIERTGQGILGFITNHSYLDNPTFRGMRQSLMNTFTDIYILNLHGNSKKKEVTLDGGKDENVFDIQQGVAIGIFAKEPGKASPATVHYADIWGLREGKYLTLLGSDIATTGWSELNPSSPFYLFIPRDDAQLDEYEKGWKVTDIFSFTGEGFTSHRDDFAVNFTLAEMEKRLKMLAEDYNPDETIREIFNLEDTGTWKLSAARKGLKNDKDLGSAIQPCLYRPFDKRFCLLHASIMDRPRMKTQSQMMKPNLALSTTRNVEITGGFSHVLCVAQVMDRHAVSLKEINYLFPLYLYSTEGEMQFESGNRRPNLNREFIKVISEKLGLKFIEDGKGDLEQTSGPEDIFNYAYAIFHSPTYRTRYAEFLKMDFPRLPLTTDKELFKSLAEKGAELVALHLMESPELNNLITGYPVNGSNVVDKVSYDNNNQRVYINKTQYFEGVPPDVWEFRIGGYQIAEKWLKDRKGRALTYDELIHYQKVIVSLKETMRLMEEIDELIPGWPMA
ncbi:type ISP restriction/modification enzyme [Dehalococcoides mccartyi]|uniref:type ISP restriction/modification enzyme n=1 Tax=Dehalococcoides mccartyi TaxID=61435 RepID=UPI002FC58F64